MSNIENAKNLIESKGGKFVSAARGTDKKRRFVVTYICKNKHTNMTRIDALSYDVKCKECTFKTRNDAVNLANKNEGKFLDEKFVNAAYEHLWECKNGHTFKNSYSNVKYGLWCKKCYTYTIEDMQKVAAERGGLCLSTIYLAKDHLDWKCKFGHQWSARSSSIIAGSWCRECNDGITERTVRKIFEFIYQKPFQKARPKWLISDQKTQLELDCYNEELKLGIEIDGAQHFKEVAYFDSNQSLIERQALDTQKNAKCLENNIQLIRIPYTIPYNKLYKHIRNLLPEDVVKTTPLDINYYTDLDLTSTAAEETLEQIKEYVSEHYPGAMVVSTIYLNSNAEMEFKCANEHVVKQTWSTVFHRKRFCSSCGLESRKRKFIELEIGDFCKLHNLSLETGIYQNNKTKMEWTCNKCHNTFDQCWANIRVRKTICDVCK
jgi:hypothetical protein